MRRFAQSNTLAIVLIFMSSSLGSLFILFITKWGPNIYSDGISYIVSARNFLKGLGVGVMRPWGVFHTLDHFPPLYPLTLSAIGVTGIDLVSAARWLNIVVFGLTLFLIGISLLDRTKSILFSVAPLFLLISSEVIIGTFINALAEPLFILLTVIYAILFLSYLERENFRLLTLSAVAVSLALLTRNAGVSLILTGGLCLMIFRRSSLKRRFLEALYFGTISILPYIVWNLSLINKVISPRTYNFNVNFWQGLTPFRLNIVNHLTSWLPFSCSYPPLTYPIKRAIVFFLALAAVVLFLFIIQSQRKKGDQDWLIHPGIRLNGFILLFILSFVAVFAFAAVYPDPPGRYGPRHYSPLKFAIILNFFTLSYFAIQSKSSKKWLQSAVLLISIATIISWAPTTLEFGQEVHTDGISYTTEVWRTSETIEAVKNLPADLPIISNEVDATLFFADRPAYRITELFHKTRLETFTRYGDDLEDQSERLFREEGAALVLFDTIEVQFENIYYGKSQKRLEAFINDLVLYLDLNDGSIYFYPKP